jgi:hypothetical protein
MDLVFSYHRVKNLDFHQLQLRARQSIITFYLFLFRALTAIATPVYVFPVPAGPTANTMSFY